MDVAGVDHYVVRSMQNGQSPITLDPVPVNVSMACVGVSDYTVSVTFTVTSLSAGGEACFTSETSELKLNFVLWVLI